MFNANTFDANRGCVWNATGEMMCRPAQQDYVRHTPQQTGRYLAEHFVQCNWPVSETRNNCRRQIGDGKDFCQYKPGNADTGPPCYCREVVKFYGQKNGCMKEKSSTRGGTKTVCSYDTDVKPARNPNLCADPGPLDSLINICNGYTAQELPKQVQDIFTNELTPDEQQIFIANAKTPGMRWM